MGESNPMRWNCGVQGCFNQKKRPKIELFADLFPRRIAMGDMDGYVELNGHFLHIEWKAVQGPIPTGQAIAFRALTRPEIIEDRHMVFVVAGDAETMVVQAVKCFRNGIEGPWCAASMASLRASIAKWVKYVESRPRPEVLLRSVNRGGT